MVDRGLYESLLTTRLQGQLALTTDLDLELDNVDPADQPHVLARHIQQLTERALESNKNEAQRLALVNRLIEVLAESDEQVANPARQLLRADQPPGPGVTRLGKRPATPLAEAALLTNTSGEPSLGAELRAELDTADEVDLLCAFVKWYGVRVLEDELERLRERGVPFRVITTTYMGATEREALDKLIRRFGAEVRIHYNTQRTRLHAKAWLFRRKTLFDTAYVGSSNLSRAALLEGLEWNVRLSRVGTPTLLEKFRATFDTYWNDPAYEPYDPDRDRDRLDDALAEASGRAQHTSVTLNLSGLEVRPYPYQSDMLESLDVERTVHGRHRNLLVAATGTGKTVVAALDYRRLCNNETGERPSLLFVAHRREILEQSLRTYREVLGDGSFGELYVGGARPERWKHVFASVQSLTSYGVKNIPADAFDIVVIDEFHHAEARTYRRILDHLAPRELLGLTATPERTDGVNVAEFFDHRIASELRLWDALEAELLSPFHYFVVADGTDLRRITWARGRYDEGELSNIFTGNDARARLVLEQLRDKVLNPLTMRALGFCVSVAHAEYMAWVFNDAGIPSRAVSGHTPTAERERALQDLRHQRVNALFAADLFNEGLDLPDVDTVLFLRPTESATVFLQQFGRGLRHSPSKAVLTALDFVGHHRREFRFDLKLRALTGRTRKGLERSIEQGFPFLPSGCQIVMDAESQARVLENVRGQIANRWKHIVAELRSYGDMSLPRFLDESGLELSDLLRNQHSWTQLRREAGLSTRLGTEAEVKLLRRVRAFALVDDPDRHEFYRRMLADHAPTYAELSPDDQRRARMLFFSFFPDHGGFPDVDSGLASLRKDAAVRDEVSAVVDLAFDETRHLSYEPSGELRAIPLRPNAHYSREEILAALDFPRNPNSMREGVVHLKHSTNDAFFVTIKKSEADYSPSTMYRDYWISDSLFHWESQSTTSVNSRTGQRYINGDNPKLLFVREQAYGEFGTAPYQFVGPVEYVSHEGERPIAITWRIVTPHMSQQVAALSPSD